MISTQASLLVRIGRHADNDAWEIFERRYGPLVLAYALRLGLSLTDAEDVRQDVLMSLVKSMRSFAYDPQAGRFRDYLHRAVQNAVFRRGKRHGRLPQRLSEDDAIGEIDRSSTAGDAEWERQWRRHHCELALQTLQRAESERNVEVFRMLLGGAETNQVAESLGLSPESVRKIKQRVRERLQEIIRAQMRDLEEGPSGVE